MTETDPGGGGEFGFPIERYFQHPAYEEYRGKAEYLYGRILRHPWDFNRIPLGQDKADFEALDDSGKLAFFFMTSHRLLAETNVAEMLGGFKKAIPEADFISRALIARQEDEEYMHSLAVFRFFREVIGIDDINQMKQVALDSMDFVSADLYARLDQRVRRLDEKPDVNNLAAAVFSYHVLAEGTIAREFSAMTAEKLRSDGKFPGFLEGHRHTMKDETDHYAIGILMLRMLDEVNPRAAGAAILEPAREFKTTIDSLRDRAIAENLDAQTRIAYGCGPEQIHQRIIQRLLVNLHSINPRLPGELAAGLTQDIDGPGGHQDHGQ